MTADEIVQRLKNILRDPRWPDLCATDTALCAAIQAVTVLEEVKAEAKGNCRYCKYHAAGTADTPCRDCFIDNDLWEFRWPLGEFHDTET